MITSKKPHKIFTLIGVLSALSFSLLFPLSLSAQTIDSYKESVRVLVNPPNPGPGKTVSISIESSLLDLNQSIITWKVDGKIIESGKDKRFFETKLGEIGKETVIKISVSNSSSGLIEKEVRINPTSVSFLYEANTYTPPFYKGKALPSSESVVTVLALPNFKTTSGTQIQSKDLVFTWKKDGVVDGRNSGLGKDFYSYVLGRLPEDTPEIEVSIVHPESNLKGYAYLLLGSVNPEIVFYENSPLLGVVLNKALVGETNLLKGEFNVAAYPYFFSGRNKNSVNYEYKWHINSEEVADVPKNQNFLTLRRPEGGKGTSAISVSLQNLQKIFQSGSNNLLINYGQ